MNFKLVNNDPPDPANVHWDSIANSNVDQCVCGSCRLELGHVARKFKEVILDDQNIMRDSKIFKMDDINRFMVLSILFCKECGKERFVIPGSEKPLLSISYLDKENGQIQHSLE